jgi:hypothetical protein
MSVTIPIHRRSFLLAAGAAGASLGAGLGAAYTQNANAADYTLSIAPLSRTNQDIGRSPFFVCVSESVKFCADRLFR